MVYVYYPHPQILIDTCISQKEWCQVSLSFCFPPPPAPLFILLLQFPTSVNSRTIHPITQSENLSLSSVFLSLTPYTSANHPVLPASLLEHLSHCLIFTSMGAPSVQKATVSSNECIFVSTMAPEVHCLHTTPGAPQHSTV